MLTAQQVAAYHRDGFVAIDGVFSPAEVEAWHAAATDDAIGAEQRRAGADERAYHLLGLTARHPAFLALARDPRLTGRVAQLLGPDLQLQHSKLATKPPKAGAGAYAWHQDFAFFPHSNTSLAAVMVLLDDADEGNGCMRMVPGSHRQGMLDHRIEGGFSGGIRPQPPADAGVPLRVRAGGITIHHCLTVHGSGANRSDRQRRGLVFQYRADDAHQLADHVFDDTGLLVAGQRRGVVRCEPGAWLLPHMPGRCEEGFGSSWRQQGERAVVLNADHPVRQPTMVPRQAMAGADA
jgi:ectoine hydroxylase-related dioxygenase (phytanoyl-CoA dioxygenase family)